ncbi:MAG: hypothetical protein N838_30495 [Thiohalocapsa sp. PB-PSB1]|jgi:hypothetical protein|nr:MAG: hypothetical protein N838_19450 [Thiohalocapsa sp. PB-PSB1]QQO58174.1 MAG: hypothetical protein N838_30495 [Thiohalocapsa sp. PB-PSB1]
MTDLLLTLTGADAEAAAAELAAALDLRSLPRTTPGDAGVHAPEVPRKTDPTLVVAGVGLALSIPGAVFAAMGIADRLGKRSKAQALIATAGRLRIERRVEVLTISVDGEIPLADLDPDHLLALAAGGQAADKEAE